MISISRPNLPLEVKKPYTKHPPCHIHGDACGQVLRDSAPAEKDDGGAQIVVNGGNIESEFEQDEKMELVLQAVLTLSREVRVLSRRVKTLSDTASRTEPAKY